MPSTAPWARYDPRIGLVIDGKEMPCVRCNIDYELSAIPQASATIAVGRGFDGKPSPAHALAENFVDRTSAQIYITPNAMGQDGAAHNQAGDLGLSGESVLIFDGFVTSASFTRSRGSAQFNVQLEHWLSELGFSSVFSKTSHPANPGHYAYKALAPTASAGAAFTTLGLAHKFITFGAINTDFWGGEALPDGGRSGLKAFLEFLCEQDAFFTWDSEIGEGSGGNDAALAALKRFNSPHQQKLALDINADLDIVSNIMNQVSGTCARPEYMASQTIWDVLVGTFGSQYLFKLVPRISDALMVPFIAGYREPFATIKSNEETQIEWIRGLGRQLRGVGVLAHTQCSAGSQMPGQAAPPQLDIGGRYVPDRDSKNGIVMIKQGPDWLTALYAPSRYSGESTGAGGKAIGNAVQPGGPQKTNMPDKVTQRLKDTMSPFLDRYAQALYALEKLQTRQAVCSSPFRLDIAPGSTVKVEVEGEQHIENDPLKAPFYAHVARVSMAIDAEQPMIGTSFHLSHIRSEKENSDDRTSIAKHPLYSETFKGCPLIDQ